MSERGARGAPAAEPFRAGVIAVVGRPNVGKSTLVNALVGTKVAIVSDKPQTTRHAIRGVLTTPSYQAVFTDTPGLHKPRSKLGERLNRRIEDAVADVDAMLMVVDAAAGVGRGDGFVAARHVRPFAGPSVCVVNKVDRVRGRGVVPQLEAAAALDDFDHVMPLSARTRRGLADLRAVLPELLPAGPPLFPEGELTDQPTELRVAELIREKALDVTREEVPHSVAVVVDELEPPDERGLVRISARVLVERESQKGILVGRGGETLKTIGTRARQDLEPLLGAHVFLDLRVKVLRDWQRDDRAMDRLGY